MANAPSSSRLLPGVLLCALVAGAAYLVQLGEKAALGTAYIEALVIAILLGTAIRTAWTPPARFQPGIGYSAKFLLEVAVMLLGTSISAAMIANAGLGLLVGIFGVVFVAIMASYCFGRLLRLPYRMSVLIACGNSICGNSAIAAVAPVIGADAEDVASSIAFTAILGVIVVLGLPLLIPVVGLSLTQYGVLAGLTVYAVPQVLAATAPVSVASMQIGTLVKLVRVLMLGPVVLALSVAHGSGLEGSPGRKRKRMKLSRLVPWFILGFIALAALRSFGLVPPVLLVPIAEVSTVLTILSMAALGLGVDVRVIGRVGGRVTGVVVGSLLLLIAISLLLIRGLSLA
jgi:uncharacterized integral membrane protein (TIGR00698 family)